MVSITDVISSRTNSRVKALRQLVRERPGGALVVEGTRLAAELAAAGLPVQALAYTPEFALSPAGSAVLANLQTLGPETVLCVTADVLDSVADTRTPQGVLAVAAPPQHGGLDAWLSLCSSRPVSLVLDAVADAGNVGTIWRTASALAAGPLLLGPGSAELFSPKVVRSAMGAAFWHPAWAAADLSGWLQAARTAGLRVVATAVAADRARAGGAVAVPQPLPGFAFDSGTIVVIGSEAHGVSPSVLDLADELLHIPLPGRAESLNAAVAAALVLYEARRGDESG